MKNLKGIPQSPILRSITASQPRRGGKNNRQQQLKEKMDERARLQAIIKRGDVWWSTRHVKKVLRGKRKRADT